MPISKLLRIVVTAVLGASAVVALQPAVADNRGLVVQVVVPAGRAADDGPVSVTLRLTNTSSTGQKILRWLTPDGDTGAVFTVTYNGRPLLYRGALYKRSAPTPDDYLTLAAHSSRAWRVSLSDSFDFEADGDYVVAYTAVSTQLTSPDGNGVHELRSVPVTVTATGRPLTDSGQVNGPTPQAVTGSISYYKCSSTQKSQLASARTNASNYASAALAWLNTYSTGLRYGRWFGVDDAVRQINALVHFRNINTALGTASVTFDCNTAKSALKDYAHTYAYVYPDKPYIIYIAGAFWSAPATGTDSKAGTLVHEMSHFNVIAGTSDYVYGQAGAMSLANSDPLKALYNADNHEYFAENNPYVASPTLTLTQGAAGSGTYAYAVGVTAANYQVTLTCRDTTHPSGFATATIGTDSNGNRNVPALCYSGSGDHWVTTATGFESNHVSWTVADNCPNGDYSGSAYDGICGTAPPTPDYCPNGDYSGSAYDGTCGSPPPSTTVGVHVEDDYYGGTWARMDPNNGTWYPQYSPPPNGAYWYPNGLGVAVDCERAAASYVVRFADGHYETWNTWFHVTDGKWYPSAATREVYTNGAYGGLGYC